MSDVVADVDLKPANDTGPVPPTGARRFASVRTFSGSPEEPVLSEEVDLEPFPDEYPFEDRSSDGFEPDPTPDGLSDASPVPEQPSAQSVQDDLARRLDPAKLCPSRIVDVRTAHEALLKETFPDGSRRNFFEEFRMRVTNFQIDVIEGRLPVEAMIYDYPEEFYDKTPEEMRVFFDRMISSTGIGADEPAENPLGVHPFLWRLFRRIEEPERAVRRLELLRGDAEYAARQRQKEAEKASVPVSSHGADTSNGVSQKGSGLPVAETADRGVNPSSAQAPASVQGAPRFGHEPVEASWRPAGSQALAARQAPSGDAEANVVPGSRQVGLLSGLWYLGGSALHRMAQSFRPDPNSNWVPREPAQDIAPVMAVAGFDTSVEAIERDCQRLCEVAAWAKATAATGPMAEAMKSFEAVSAARGMEGDALWRAVHDAANGAVHDPEIKALSDTLASAMREQGLDAPLREMATVKSELMTRCHNRLLELSDQGEEAKPDLERIDAAVSRLKDAELPFEKPGEDTGLRELAKFAERIKRAVERVFAKLFGRGTEAEAAPAGP